MLKTIVLVPVIMACATGGTIGLIKLINNFLPKTGAPRKTIVDNTAWSSENNYKHDWEVKK